LHLIGRFTGSSNILSELKVAAQWNRKQLGRRLTDRKLVDMVTSIPAHIAGVEDLVGSISAGLRADIVVINGDQKNPYGAVIEASAANVDLVFIEGVPIYGETKNLWSNSGIVPTWK
jgi:cytosine/adenosine deaminase-related metal-dependent hydrolase